MSDAYAARTQQNRNLEFRSEICYNSAMNALTLVHSIISSTVKKGDTCIDATAGRGYDTAFLCGLVGESGRVVAFDIQQDAIDSTNKLLAERGLKAEVVHRSHEFMAEYAESESVSAIVFNLGYLPGGDHTIFTHADSSIRAITAGLELLRHGGIMCVSIYHGGATGYEERDALLEWLKELDTEKYQVLVVRFHNWRKDPPIPVIIMKF